MHTLTTVCLPQVLAFDDRGKHVYEELTRNDILQRIRQAEATREGTDCVTSLRCLKHDACVCELVVTVVVMPMVMIRRCCNAAVS